MSVSRSDVFEAVATAFRLAWPSRDELLAEAEANAADEHLFGLLASLPDRRYHDLRDVWRELPELAGR